MPIPRVDQELDSLGKGQVFYLFNPVSSFHSVTVHKEIVPLTVFCTPTALYEWLVVPQSINSPSPGWFIKGLEHVAVYLDSVIVFVSSPTADAETIRSLFERLDKHNIKLFPPKDCLGATDTDFMGHSFSPASMRPAAEKVSALITMPMTRDLSTLAP